MSAEVSVIDQVLLENLPPYGQASHVLLLDFAVCCEQYPCTAPVQETVFDACAIVEDDKDTFALERSTMFEHREPPSAVQSI